jgi:hypothetical protein
MVMIIPIITTKLKCPDAVGEARMLHPPHDGVSSSRAAINLSSVSLGLIAYFSPVAEIPITNYP